MVGRVDNLVVQNVTFALEVAVLVFLSIALFFTLISFVPGYRSEGSFTGPRFAEAAQASALICSLIRLLFFLENWRTGWPWLLTTAFFFLNGYLQFFVAKTDRTKSMTVLVASIGRVPAFAFGLTIFLALLWMAWRVQPATRMKPVRITEPSST